MLTTQIQVKDKVDMADISNASPKKIWFSSRTCWWTHAPNDAKAVREYLFNAYPETYNDKTVSKDTVLDPSGAVCNVATNYKEFIRTAQQNRKIYGVTGFAVFQGTHHQNSFQLMPANAPDDTPENTMVCSNRFQDYDRSILTRSGRFKFPEPEYLYQVWKSEVMDEFFYNDEGVWRPFNMNLALNADKLITATQAMRQLHIRAKKSTASVQGLTVMIEEAERKVDGLVSVLSKQQQ